MKQQSNYILIAEDDDISFDYVSLILTKSNYQVLRAQTGGDAVEQCRRNSGIVLVLMDIKMPVMDGYTATREIHAFKPGIPIIAATAYALPGDSDKAMAAGCNDYLPKPIRKEELLSVIRKYIG